MSGEPKVSIVVPVYNVESVIHKSLYSIVNQTYKDYEVLLIDDGSIDMSGKICDEYAKKYEFVRAFHRENGGLSDARNFAIPYIKGQYVTYVDSDDYIEPDFLEVMIMILNDYKADMVISSTIEELSYNYPENRVVYSPKDIILFSSEEALEEMCYERMFGTSACAKLLPVELVKRYPFPVKKTYEDLATIYKMIGDVKRVAYTNLKLYHYIVRKGSIRNSGWKQSVIEVMEAADSLMEYINAKYPQIYDAAVQRYFFSMNEVYVRAFSEADYLQIIAVYREKAKRMKKSILHNKKIYLVQKIRYFLMLYGPKLYRKIWYMAKKH